MSDRLLSIAWIAMASIATIAGLAGVAVVAALGAWFNAACMAAGLMAWGYFLGRESQTQDKERDGDGKRAGEVVPSVSRTGLGTNGCPSEPLLPSEVSDASPAPKSQTQDKEP